MDETIQAVRRSLVYVDMSKGERDLTSWKITSEYGHKGLLVWTGGDIWWVD